GAAVTVLEAARPLAAEDAECAEAVLNQLRREGIVLRSGVKIARTGRIDGGGVKITLEADEDNIEASHLLIATGRTPSFSSLDLDKAGIRTDPSGLLVNKRLRTTNI